jgi:hypothetical protein
MSSTVYPMGTTIYNPEKCWNGYTLFQSRMHSGADAAAVLIDMNGNTVNMWKHLDGFPNKMLPGGYVLGSTGMRNPKFGFQDMTDLVQVDWDGNIVWKFKKYELIKDPEQKPAWMARQHHDYQREGNPVGYYAPKLSPQVNKGKTLILSHKNLQNPGLSGKPLLDDTVIEVNWNGKVVWEWICSEHFAEMGFSEEAKNTIYRNPNIMKSVAGEHGDWMHINSISWLGPNKWHDKGDTRFHPDNIILDGRSTNVIAIVSRQTGKIVWQLGPDYFAVPALKELGQIIGQHHVHMIPRGLPGEGNILLFDNGGSAGYGTPNPGAPTGMNNALRDNSRVLELDPITLKTIWQYPPKVEGPIGPVNTGVLYSSFISSAQRLPNCNTLITEGASGRIFEVTSGNETVWEYISPFIGSLMGPPDGPPRPAPLRKSSMIYRAYRVPYEWIPQVAKPEEKALPPIDISKFRVPGSPRAKAKRITILKKSAAG